MWCSHTGNHAQQELAQIRLWSESKVETYKNLAIFWQPAGTYCQKYGNFRRKKIPLKYRQLWHIFFPQKSFVWVTLDVFLVAKWQNFPMEKTRCWELLCSAFFTKAHTWASSKTCATTTTHQEDCSCCLETDRSDCETSLHSINGVEIHTWKKENHLTVCHYHPGYAVFHDRSKGVKNFYACFCHWVYV